MTTPGSVQVVTFGLAEETFAIPVGVVREILDWCEVFRLPNGPDYLLGLTDVRGEAVPMIDLRVRLGMPHLDPTPATRILVVDIPLPDRALALGLMVDRVNDVTILPAGRMNDVPDIGRRWNSDYMRGVARTDNSFIVLLDVQGLFSDEDPAALAA